MGYIPQHKYSFAPEIFEYSKAIARHFNLYEDACFQTGVTELRWDEADSRWIISTDRGDRMRAKFVAMANGPLNRPKLPGIPGVNEFKGYTFHTSRWDYGYTGGDSNGNLTGLADKRVGIIGTGATAIQCIPHLGESAKHLYVFQRTPSSVDFRNNRETDPDWAKTLEPGWQQRRMDNFNILVSGGDQDVDLVADGWTDIFRNLTGIAAKQASRKLGRRLTPAEKAELMEMSDFQKMEQCPRASRQRGRGSGNGRSAQAVVPPVLQASLLPRRVPAHVQPAQRDVGRHRRQGRRAADGERRRGRRQGVRGRLPGLRYRLRGRHRIHPSRRLRHHRARRHDALEEMVRGPPHDARHADERFPELLLPGLHADCGHRQRAVRARTSRRSTSPSSSKRHAGAAHDTVEASLEGEQAWLDEMRSKARLAEKFYSSCTPGYYNNEGNLGNPLGFFAGMYGAGPIKFFQLLDEWRADQQFAGVDLR